MEYVNDRILRLPHRSLPSLLSLCHLALESLKSVYSKDKECMFFFFFFLVVGEVVLGHRTNT